MKTRLTWVSVLILVLALVVALMSAPLAQAQVPTKTPVGGFQGPQATQEVIAPQPTAALPPDTSRVRINVQPGLGFQIMDPANGPNYFEGRTTGGGSDYIYPGEPCLQGYSTGVAALGMIWTDDSGRVDIGFTPDEPGVRTAVMFYDLSVGEWWCNTSYAEDQFMRMTNIAPGAYYVYVLTEQPSSLLGTMYVVAAPAE